MRNLPLPPTPLNPLLWGRGEEGIIIFDVLNTYYSQEQNMSLKAVPPSSSPAVELYKTKIAL